MVAIQPFKLRWISNIQSILNSILMLHAAHEICITDLFRNWACMGVYLVLNGHGIKSFEPHRRTRWLLGNVL